MIEPTPFSAERGGQYDGVVNKMRTQWDRKMSKTGVNVMEFIFIRVCTCPSDTFTYGSALNQHSISPGHV